jgi:UDP-N-acetylglucosamine--N-acetylmuramyl-(pentapeptide) pyrophosphoryl-undecaprenol N-acetylglucosamine transferase
MKENLRIIISGGGTGGHIFPAISIANAIKEICPDTDILFVGAEGRMEMQRVPAAGYPIKGLPVAGFDRKNLFKNIPVLIKLFKSQRMAKQIINEFQPHAAVGVGGYASGPTLKVAGNMGIPTLLQEQNSYAGVTNKLLAKQAHKICVAYDGMERFFDKSKIILTGNPVRQGLLNHTISRDEAIRTFHLDPQKKTVLILGGSLGARTINQCVIENIAKIKESGVQFIWQTGKVYINDAIAAIANAGDVTMLHVTDFISNMAAAYSAADLVISRAGAGSISEFCLLEKPVILVPSPNVAEDHQTKNALALVNKNAALYVKDVNAKEELIDKAIQAVNQPDLLNNLSINISKLAFADSATIIAKEVIKLAKKYKEEHGC